ncbi:MAG: HAD hydrolase-like protein [Myxococcota bacterium]
MSDAPRNETTIDDLIERYDALLFDAYGVLVRSDGPVDGALELLRRLRRQDTPFLVLTNDASRTIRASAMRYRAMGLPIEAEHVITSGSLVTGYAHKHNLIGRPAWVMGPTDARTNAREAGLELLALDAPTDTPFEVCVLADLPFTDAWPAVEDTVTRLIRALDAGRTPRLVLPNPDLIYPRTLNSFGVTSGGAAAMITTILEERYPGASFSFDLLGKPHPPIYEQALETLGVPRTRAVMIGDQLATDVRGALAVGIDAALVTTGLVTLSRYEDWPVHPTWLLASLRPSWAP